VSVGEMLRAHLGSGQVSRVVYGSIIGLALVLALEAHPPALRFIIGSIWATAIAVAFAEFYSEWVGRATREGLGVESEPWRVSAADAAGVAFGILFPSIFFVIAAFGWMDVDTAFNFAQWTGLALIASYGYIAARLSGASPLKATLQATTVGLMAFALIVVKSLLH
jgi:VIT1/CCC1 family predicted Fe2+/Mn2+ transporter